VRDSEYDLNQQLNIGLTGLDIEASEEQRFKLITLLEQLIKWNKTYNLTAIKTPQEGLVLHLLDSLAVLPYLHHKQLLDVGTGAGFPGLPLAVLLPEVKFTLLDSNSKKIRFIRQQIHTLQLDNVEAIHSRVEDQQELEFEAIISRAFASISDMIAWTEHLLAKNGSWLAMKGHYEENEVKEISLQVQVVANHRLSIPGLDAQRCVIELKRIG